MLLVALLLSAPASASALLVEIEGLDDCCAVKVVSALQALPGVRAVGADVPSGAACLGFVGSAPDDAAVRAAVTGAGFATRSVRAVDTCPEGMKLAPTDPWAAAEGLDFVVVSRGDAFALTDHAPADKVTIFEFGARWCGPCWDVAATLTAALKERPWLAVRATELVGADAFASFATAAAKQHLGGAEGIPWMLVRTPKGRIVYRGSDPAAALAAAERYAP